ncbi:MAG: EAL domain-containing protein [Woeseiaceae bacterium]|nr:EAL domain-containing protein [Woeseiaceae bacterium]
MTSLLSSLQSRIDARPWRRSGQRLLVNEILSIQILSAAIVGAVAIVMLYWGGQWVLKDNYGRWALQWTEELNELGSPLYLADDNEALIRLESFTERYPEIASVVYYDRNGEALFSIDKATQAAPPDDLPAYRLADASDVVGSEHPYLFSPHIANSRRFDILAPVWTEKIASDDLFGFDPKALESQASTEIRGFVAIHLDFAHFHEGLLANIRNAVLLLAVLLVALATYGRRVLQRALRSISQLEDPINELAKGNLGVEFKSAGYRETATITEALKNAASAIATRDAELLDRANHDSLTGLYNRRRFSEELRAALDLIERRGGSAALLFVDLDQFKYINDLCGHPAGDRLIRKVADVLSSSVGDEGFVARFGGDEFAVLFPGAGNREAREAADRILTDMRRLTHIENEHVFHVHCSIGMTIATSSNLQLDELIAQADIACREAKRAGRNRARLFDGGSLTESGEFDLGWINRLRGALDNDNFELHFQPINDIQTGRTTHHEVLLRARHEDGSLVSPDAFLPAAVRFGMMSEIDLWVIRHSAIAYTRFVKQHRDLKLSINISAHAFESEDLPAYIGRTLVEFDVPPQNIVLEITESLAIRHAVHVERQIAELRALGCKLALDDFGTGYSALSYLQKLDCDYIKIDGAFVADIVENPVEQKVIRLIAEIGQEAGMRVIAEYVESAEALVLLSELGVDMAQGFFVGRPTAEPEFPTTPISIQSRRQRGRNRQGY